MMFVAQRNLATFAIRYPTTKLLLNDIPISEILRQSGGLKAATKRLLFSTKTDDASPSITLYQYAICPFCHKAKAFLSYANVSQYESIEVNPLTKAELKPWSGDYRKVPIAKIDGKQVNGSDEIVDALLDHPYVIESLEQKWNDKDGTNTNTHKKMDMELFRGESKWTDFAQKDLAALLYPNICSTLTDSYNAFNYVHNVKHFSLLQKISIQSIGSLAMYFAASKIKSKRGITDEKLALQEALTTWKSDALENGTKLYESGMDHPSMGDVAVFGTLWSVEGLSSSHSSIMENDDVLREWYQRMKQQVLQK